MTEREVRYCTTEDGVRIAYTDTGDGTPMVSCPHLFESFSLDHLFPLQADVRRKIAAGHRLIRYDMRGTGLSQREVDDVSHAALVRDVEAVVEATAVADFSLVCSAMGGARGVDYASRHPERLTHLVLWGAYANFGELYPGAEFRSFVEFARSNWALASQALVDTDLRMRRAMAQPDMLGFGKLLRESVSGEMAANLLLSMYETADVKALLASVRVATLIIDQQASAKRAQEFAATIPNARLVLVTGGSSFLPENAQPGVEAIREFIGDVPAATPLLAGFRTVLFTDLVGHTEMMQRLGDERGRDVLREHERITRETLAAHGGAEVKTMGDGFMASFGSVTKAMDCAIALQRAFDAHEGEPLHVRVGLNAGEPIEEDGDLFGSTVILASRIAAQAGAGEILIPEPLRHLLSGKSYVYTDRGEVALKGFEDAVRLYEVRWRE
jgi:class 3 adenylate cyclase